MAVDVQESGSRWTRVLTLVIVAMLAIALWSHLKSIATFVILLSVLIYIHELGHFLAAKRVGVRVHEFAIGMGPRLVTLMRRGDTDYTIRVLPIGGFVSMAGMQPEETDVEDGLAAKSAPARALVFAAGPAMNLILALVVMCSMGFITGAPDEKKVEVGSLQPGKPAASMGLKPDDQILTVRGVPITDARHLVEVVSTSPPGEMVVEVRRGDQVLALRGSPEPIIDKATGKTRMILGLTPGRVFGPRTDILSSIRFGSDLFMQHLKELASLISTRKIVENVGGPVQIYSITAQASKVPFGREFAFNMLYLLASLSISLGVLNLLPIPVLDGGHLFLLGVEVLRRKRLTPDAVKVTQLVGVAVLGLIFFLIMYKDIRGLLS